MEGAAGLSAGLTKRPQPPDIDVSMADGRNINIERFARIFDTLSEKPARFSHVFVEALAERVTGIQSFKCLVEGVK